MQQALSSLPFLCLFRSIALSSFITIVCLLGRGNSGGTNVMRQANTSKKTALTTYHYHTSTQLFLSTTPEGIGEDYEMISPASGAHHSTAVYPPLLTGTALVSWCETTRPFHTRVGEFCIIPLM